MKFIPEERAKKLSFDRMIFKLEPTEETLKVWDHDFEYRFDITLVSILCPRIRLFPPH
jgi:hypothetical protein